jgi:lipoyl synthase
LEGQSPKYTRKPEWLRIKITRAHDYSQVKGRLTAGGLHTICESGTCPNKAECWASGTATFMILGNICTRNCRFCNVTSGKPLPPDPEEPARVARAIHEMGVKHCVITSVDRDDLEDGGAGIWAETLSEVRKLSPSTTLEALIPDFMGEPSLLQKVMDQKPEVISHNLETVRRLTRSVRSVADYDRSLGVIACIAGDPDIRTKSGIMLGLGETEKEVLETMDDLLGVGCQVLTLGQYLQPGKRHLPVARYVHPDEFQQLGEIAKGKGFRFVESAPLVRSSYHAEKHV